MPRNRLLAARLKPDYADIFNSLGVACAGSGDAQQAIGYFRRAVEINPRYAMAHKNLGNVLANTGEVAAATTILSKQLRSIHNWPMLITCSAHYCKRRLNP